MLTTDQSANQSADSSDNTGSIDSTNTIGITDNTDTTGSTGSTNATDSADSMVWVFAGIAGLGLLIILALVILAVSIATCAKRRRKESKATTNSPESSHEYTQNSLYGSAMVPSVHICTPPYGHRHQDIELTQNQAYTPDIPMEINQCYRTRTPSVDSY